MARFQKPVDTTVQWNAHQPTRMFSVALSNHVHPAHKGKFAENRLRGSHNEYLMAARTASNPEQLAQVSPS